MGKILFKQGNGLLSVIPVLLRRKRWYVDFKRDRTDTNDAEHSARPTSAGVPENTQKRNSPQTPLADRKLKLREIAEELKISKGTVFTILYK